VSVFFQ